jgi:hypothetical protein
VGIRDALLRTLSVVHRERALAYIEASIGGTLLLSGLATELALSPS